MAARRELGRHGHKNPGGKQGGFRVARGRGPLLLGAVLLAVVGGLGFWAVLWGAGVGLHKRPSRGIASQRPTFSPLAAPEHEAASPQPEATPEEPVPVPPQPAGMAAEPSALPPEPSAQPPEPPASPPEPSADPPEPSAVPPKPAFGPPEPDSPEPGLKSPPSAAAPAPSELGKSAAGTPGAAQAEIQALRQEVAEVAARLPKDFPDRVDALIIFGEMHAGLGNSAAALETWQRCLELDPARPDVYQAMGELAMRKGEFEQALALWQKAQQIDPKMPGIYYCLARALLNLRQTAEAITALEKELEVSPASATCHYLLGQAYLQAEEYEKARQSYENAIENQPDLWNAYYGLAIVHARLGHADKAKEYRDRFKQLKSADLRVSIERTAAFDDLGAMRRTVAPLYAKAGVLYRQSGDLAKAERLWLRAAALEPKDTQYREYLAWLYQATHRESKALAMYRQLSELDPQNAVYCVNVGIGNARLDRFEAAEEAFVKAQQLAPQQSLAYRALAQLYLRNNRKLAEAKVLAEKAVELESVAANYFVLSEAHDKAGDRQGAVAALRRAMQLDPDNPTYRQVYERLQQE
jgi:tetratricopeptide (TPR) repeat protein